MSHIDRKGWLVDTTPMDGEVLARSTRPLLGGRVFKMETAVTHTLVNQICRFVRT